MDRQRRPWTRIAAAGAVALGIATGSYGIASAASGSGSSSSSSSGSIAAAATAAPSAQQPWGGQRSDETPLTGTTLDKVSEVALAKVAGGTIVRVETDADGNALYEAHMVNADGM